MNDRAREIESFYWLLIRIGAAAFGYLMMIGGGILALAFAAEKWRTGAVAFGGAQHAHWQAALAAIAIPAGVALVGWAIVRAIRRYAERR